MAKAKGADKHFIQDTKRLDKMRRRRTMLPVLIVVGLLIAFSFTPWAGGPVNLAKKTAAWVQGLVTGGGDAEPDAKYW